jgi:hypothetical protein
MPATLHQSQQRGKKAWALDNTNIVCDMHPLQLFLVPYTLTLVSLQRREVMTDAIYSQEGVGEFLDCFWNHDKSTGRSLLVHMTIWISKFSQCDIDMEQKA